jgi:prevent-host-death family protein
MVTMKATEARNNIGSLWDKATEEPVMIESAGKPIAVVLSVEEYSRLATARLPRQFGCGRHLLSGAGINVNDLLATPVDDVFSEYMPDAAEMGDVDALCD